MIFYNEYKLNYKFNGWHLMIFYNEYKLNYKFNGWHLMIFSCEFKILPYLIKKLIR